MVQCDQSRARGLVLPEHEAHLDWTTNGGVPGRLPGQSDRLEARMRARVGRRETSACQLIGTYRQYSWATEASKKDKRQLSFSTGCGCWAHVLDDVATSTAPHCGLACLRTPAPAVRVNASPRADK